LGLNYLVSKAGNSHQPNLLDLAEPTQVAPNVPVKNSSQRKE
jgi:hypothetical protein